MEEKLIMQCGIGIGVTKVYGLCSGGKDSMSACAVAHKIRPLDGIILVDTTIVARNGDDKPSYIAARKFAEQIGVPFICIKPKDDLKKGYEEVPCIGKYGMGKTYENYCKKYGFPHAGQHDTAMRWLKKKALVGFVMSQTKSGERIALISGVRENESSRREVNSQIIGIDDDTPRIIWIAPIYHWTTKQAYAYVKENNYTLSESYTMLHISGDCLCGAFAKKEESHLISMFYPDTGKQIVEIEKVAGTNHGGLKHWGNGDSMCAAQKQKRLQSFACGGDCEAKYDPTEEHNLGSQREDKNEVE